MYVSRRKGEAPPTPYLLPGIPGVTAALPTLGIISRQREPAINRDRFFDVILAGPLLGLAAALTLYILGALVSIQSAVPLQSCQQVDGTATLCPSVIQMGLDAVVGPLMPHVAPGYSALSPLADGATVGLILTFVGLLPMASFEQGGICTTTLALGTRGLEGHLLSERHSADLGGSAHLLGASLRGPSADEVGPGLRASAARRGLPLCRRLGNGCTWAHSLLRCYACPCHRPLPGSL